MHYHLIRFASHSHAFLPLPTGGHVVKCVCGVCVKRQERRRRRERQKVNAGSAWQVWRAARRRRSRAGSGANSAAWMQVLLLLSSLMARAPGRAGIGAAAHQLRFHPNPVMRNAKYKMGLYANVRPLCLEFGQISKKNVLL